MNQKLTYAQRLLAGTATAETVATGIISLKANNFVERPWGGLEMLNYKGSVPLPDQKKIAGMGVGEAFETAACQSDEESNAYPSIVELQDGSHIPLHVLLAGAGAQILGNDLYKRFRGEIPLLPKTLDIAELLSVQAHPPGNTELYYIIHADPGASIRLGFRQSIDAQSLREQLSAGRANQVALLELLQPAVDQHALHNFLAPSFADRDGAADSALAQLAPLLKAGADQGKVRRLYDALKLQFWYVLDLMNEVSVRSGQFIHNATPARLRAITGAGPAAEVHALGNPQGREILMLEVRRPGVTYRAWDNVRFPMRDIDIDKTLSALNLSATGAEEFAVTPEPLPAEPGVSRVVNCAAFVVDQLRPDATTPVSGGGRFETLHAIRGECTIIASNGDTTLLTPGRSVLVPASLSGYRIEAAAQAELVRIFIPPANEYPDTI